MIAKKHPVVQFDKNWNKIAEYESVKEAAALTPCSITAICHCCSGLAKTSWDYHWKYKEDTINEEEKKSK